MWLEASSVKRLPPLFRTTASSRKAVVQLLCEVLRIDYRFILPNNRVHILKEHNPRHYWMQNPALVASWCSRKLPAVWKNLRGMIGALRATSLAE